MVQIAIYGKGGIGKSTVSANLTAALASRGKRVLQIGCDPKHDSTRLLHHGKKVQTVLDYLLNTPTDDQKADDILMEGYLGAGCVEAGGPRPGMGCAGRGILTSFDFLNKFQVFSCYDTVLYDVLGDVVCGGFAVPVRKQYSNVIFLVTSGESMAIYAANNILQGIKNLNPNENRIAGIIYNSRGIGDRKERVFEFAQAVALPVVAEIPRSDAFANAERLAKTVVEIDPACEEARIFLRLADQISGGPTLYEARPLSEEQMERFMQGKPLKGDAAPKPPPPRSAGHVRGADAPAPAIPKKRALSDPFSRVPLFGCAYRGAVDLAVHIKDAAVLGHAPKSCTWFAVNGYSAYARRGLFERGIIYPAFIPQNFENTDITMRDAVYGGVEHARQKALSLVEKGVKTIIGVTACVPGMSGDDLTPVKNELARLGCEMYIVQTDGVEAGDYNQGMALCYKTLAGEAVYEDVPQDKDSINIVYEHTISSKADQNFEKIKEILDGMGIRVNCRFLCAGSIEDIHGFLRAPYSVMARTDPLGQELKEIFESRYGCKFVDGVIPRGFGETSRWVERLGRLYGREAEAETLIEKAKKAYETRLEELKAPWSGKRVLIFLGNADYDWLFELAEDLELDVVKTIIRGAGNKTDSRWNRRFSAEFAADQASLEDAVKQYAPDVVLLDSFGALTDPPTSLSVINILRDVDVGFFAGLDSAHEWLRLLDRPPEGRWKHDKSVFEKYYG